MRLDSISPRTSAPARSGELKSPLWDPYATWLRMMYAGSFAAALGSLVTGGWSYALVMMSVQGIPSRHAVDAAFPYATLGSVAINWIGTWLLTSPLPLYKPTKDGGPATDFNRLRTGVLRLVVTGLFVLWSLRLFGLIGEGPRPLYREIGFWCAAQGLEALAIILLWFHLLAVAGQLRSRVLRARSIIVLIGRGGTVAFMGLGPTLYAAVTNTLPALSRDFVNIRNALFVVWSCVSMLVLIRFTAAFRSAAVLQA